MDNSYTNYTSEQIWTMIHYVNRIKLLKRQIDEAKTDEEKEKLNAQLKVIRRKLYLVANGEALFRAYMERAYYYADKAETVLKICGMR